MQEWIVGEFRAIVTVIDRHPMYVVFVTSSTWSIMACNTDRSMSL